MVSERRSGANSRAESEKQMKQIVKKTAEIKISSGASETTVSSKKSSASGKTQASTASAPARSTASPVVSSDANGKFLIHPPPFRSDKYTSGCILPSKIKPSNVTNY